MRGGRREVRPGRLRMCQTGTQRPPYFSGGIQMDVGQLGQLIASLGFPIVAACAMFWYVNKEAERHRAESKDMQKSLNDNTKVLEGLKELITILVQKIGD